MSNPILNEKNFLTQERLLEGEPMTVQSTINKVFILFVCLLAGAAISLHLLFSGQLGLLQPLLGISGIVGFILVLATCFNIKIAKYTAPPYALLEGIFLGSLSAIVEKAYPGIVIQAVLGTFAVLFIMLSLYKAKMIRYTQKFAAVLMTSLLSIVAIYVIQIIASFFGRGIPGIFEAGIVGIGFSLFVIVVAAMSLIQDFYFIESGEQNMLEKDYEWFGAMGLMITLVWLYTEILRLLAKLQSRR